ncbi:MAG: hypothetical protein A2008_04430 [Candidatus Wallbacteria bacterium GWC2_49_35]|uniref:Rhamnogalacturonan lyase domain-containing protein n=1 Tax=Candidatus Wallbacteria bacterium GWC2_49_35 TaxID=1817813 RepID=A0A1F7WS94_9BACT|nr:MAG: hypothetical protein A2008_04430 [Candidatus Wallbacteria bacterium GWC2_49_35]HBC75295.1 hypothetical protein [Candidatus Wallbacteria bacterium]
MDRFKIYIGIKPFFIFAAAVLLACCGCFGNQDDGALQAQLTNDPASTDVITGATGTLGGFVLSDANNKFNAPSRAMAAVDKVTVTLLETGLFTYTDRYGYYEFPGLAPGNYTVFAKRTDSEGLAYINYSAVSVRAGEKTLNPQSIVLKKSASIFGRVAASDGGAASGFMVSLENYPAAALTSDGGYFMLDAVPSEQAVYLRIARDGYAAKRYGPVNALENKVCSINELITLDPDASAAGTISGTTADDVTGAPLAAVFIKLYESTGGGTLILYKTAYGDGSGSFSIGAAAGKNYIVEFIRHDYFNQTRSVSLASGANISLSIIMSRARSGLSYYTIAGRVRDGSGNPVAGAEVRSVPYSEQILTGADGSYKINISEGIYDLYAGKPGYAEATVRVSAFPYVNVPAEINFTLVKSNFTALYALSGTVTDVDNAPLAAAKVSIDKNNLYTYTNQAGFYTLHIASGTYEINASGGAGLEKTIDYYMGFAPQTLNIKIIKN